MKIGKISSTAGDEIVASIHLTKKPLDLFTAKKLCGKPVFLEDSKNATLIGRITNVIGRTDEPYAVIAVDKRKKTKSADKLLDRLIFTPFKIDL